jgi:hypothetical protein
MPRGTVDHHTDLQRLGCKTIGIGPARARTHPGSQRPDHQLADGRQRSTTDGSGTFPKQRQEPVHHSPYCAPRRTPVSPGTDSTARLRSEAYTHKRSRKDKSATPQFLPFRKYHGLQSVIGHTLYPIKARSSASKASTKQSTLLPRLLHG